MAGYIYLPVPTHEMIDFATDWQDGQRAKGKVPYQILKNFESGWRKGAVRALGKGVLRNVAAADKLYILAHGNSLGSAAIGAKRGATRSGLAWTGGTSKKYTPDELADVLQAEGLPTNFVDLRVFACGSATTPATGAATASFAQRLKNAMVALGYNAIIVTGYEGALKTSYSQRKDASTPSGWTPDDRKGSIVKDAHGGLEVVPASTKKVTF